MQNEKRLIGIIEVLASGFCFGFLGIFGKRALASGISPGELLALRYSLAAIMMAVIVVSRQAWRTRRISDSVKILWLGWGNALTCLILGVFGYAVFSSFYFYALKSISASMTVILLYTYPILVTVGGIIFLGERASREQKIAVPLSFVGMILLVLEDLSRSATLGFNIGLLFGFLSAVFYSVYVLVSARKLRGLDPWVSSCWIQLGAGVILFLMHFRSAGRVAQVLETSGWDLILLSFVCTVLAMTLFLSGLIKILSWEASLLSMAEPITGVLVGVFLLGEVLTSYQWFGAALVLAALALVAHSSATAKN